jgi:hypothetical protein
MGCCLIYHLSKDLSYSALPIFMFRSSALAQSFQMGLKRYYDRRVCHDTDCGKVIL